MTTVGELEVLLTADAGPMIDALKKADGTLDTVAGNFSDKLDAIGSRMTQVGGAVTGLTAPLLAGLGLAIKSAADAEVAQTQLRTVLKSTGGAAGVTEAAATKLASALQSQTRYSDEAVMSAESMMLTFTNVGNNVFPTAIETALDMSTALGQDLKSSAMQLGKALNDPIDGVTALRRVGVNLTDAQKKQIETLVKSGKTMEAQQIILKELSTEFGGSAKAAGETFAGKLDILRNSLDDVGERIGGAVIPRLTNLLDNIKPVVQGVLNWADANPELVGQIGLVIGALGLLGPALIIGGQLIGAIATIVPVLTGALGLLTSPLVLIAGGFGLIMAAGGTLPQFLEDIGTDFGGVKDGLDKVWGGLKQIIEGDPNGGLAKIAGGLGDIGTSVLKLPWDLIKNLATAVGNLIGIDVPGGLAAWGPALDAVGKAINITLDNIKHDFEGFVLRISEQINTMVMKAASDLSPDGKVPKVVRDNLDNSRFRLGLFEAAQSLNSETNIFDLGKIIDFDTSMGTFHTSLLEILGSDEAWGDVRLSVKEQWKTAIEDAAKSGNTELVNVAMPLAVRLGLNSDDLRKQLQESIAKAISTRQTAEDAFLPGVPVLSPDPITTIGPIPTGDEGIDRPYGALPGVNPIGGPASGVTSPPEGLSAAVAALTPTLNIAPIIQLDQAATMANSQQAIMSGLQGVLDGLLGVGTTVGALAKGAGNQSFSAVISVLTTILADASDIAKQLQDHVTTAAGQQIDKATIYADVTVLAHKVVLDRLIGSVNAAIAGIGGAGGGDTPGIPHFAGGGNTGSYEGLAYVHPNETIRNASQEASLWRGRGGSGGSVVVNAYGESPYELARMVDRARSEMGV